MSFGAFDVDCGCDCTPTVDPNCIEFTETFSYADTTTIAGDWVETSGSWEVVDEAVQTQDSNAILDASSDADDNVAAGISIDVFGENDGDEIRIYGKIIDRTSTLRECYVELVVGSSALIRLVCNSETYFECSVTAPENEWHTFRFAQGQGIGCSGGTKTLFYLNDNIEVNFGSFAGTARFNKKALKLGTGTTTGVVKFDNVETQRVSFSTSQCYPCQVIPWYDDDTLRSAQDVVISGCAITALNGMYTLSSVGYDIGLGRIGYIWQLSGLNINTGLGTNVNVIQFRMYWTNTGGGVSFIVIARDSFWSAEINWASQWGILTGTSFTTGGPSLGCGKSVDIDGAGSSTWVFPSTTQWTRSGKATVSY